MTKRVPFSLSFQKWFLDERTDLDQRKINLMFPLGLACRRTANWRSARGMEGDSASKQTAQRKATAMLYKHSVSVISSNSVTKHLHYST